MRVHLQWWFIFCSSLMFTFLTWYFGILDILYINDFTYISWCIILIYYIFSLRIGHKIYQLYHGEIDTFFNFEWYISEMCVNLGMIGTVIGFIFMLSTAFIALDFENTETLQLALSSMAMGMGTALWTTLVGLICSVLLKIQLVLVDEYET